MCRRCCALRVAQPAASVACPICGTAAVSLVLTQRTPVLFCCYNTTYEYTATCASCGSELPASVVTMHRHHSRRTPRAAQPEAETVGAPRPVPAAPADRGWHPDGTLDVPDDENDGDDEGSSTRRPRQRLRQSPLGVALSAPSAQLEGHASRPCGSTWRDVEDGRAASTPAAVPPAAPPAAPAVARSSA
jgi:hypothetical protein